MDWFCYHVETIDNPKIQTLPPPLFKHWVNLLCLAKRGGGTLPGVEQVAFYMRTTKSRASAVVAELIERRLFDDHGEEGIKPHDWGDWQPKSDAGAAERMRNFREREREKQRNPLRNSDATPRARAVSISISSQSQSQFQSQSALDSAFPVLCEMWHKGGKPLNDRDKEKALRKLMEYPGEEEQILRWCAHKFTTDWREPQFTPYPDSKNGLGSEGWRRPIVERTIPTREDVKQAEFSRRVAEGVAREEAKKRDRS